MGEKRKLIVVLGMHRSGTSALTRSLEVLGVQLGENVHLARFDNPKGFWEDIECAHINEDLLRHYGSSWDGFLPAGRANDNGEDINTLKIRAIRYLNTKLQENDGLWAFKDPRTCRLLGFWKDVFDTLDCDVTYLLAIRNPMAVARSLFERDKISTKKAYMLWSEHMIAALQDTDGCRRLVVEYDNFVDNPHEQLSRISKAVDLSPPQEDSAAYKEYKDSFLSTGLRHHHFGDLEFNADCNASALTKKIYSFLHGIAVGTQHFDSQETVSIIRSLIAEWQNFTPILALSHEMEQSLASREMSIATLEERVHNLAAQYEEKCLQVVSQEKSIEAYAANAGSLENEIKAYAAHAAQLQDHRDSLLSNNEENRQLIAALEHCVDERSQQIAALEHCVDERSQQIAALEHCVDERSQQIATLEQAVAAYAAHTGSLENEVKAYAAHARSLEVHRAQLMAELDVLKQQLRKMRKTKAWRLRQRVINFKKKAVDPLKKPFIFRSYKQNSPIVSNVPAQSSPLRPDPALPSTVQPTEGIHDYIGRFSGEALPEKPVRMICFYLPQFHPIPENNAWWGEGFTEWTNVRPAVPQFEGHYQPHIPDELGYYNLLDGETQKKQVELAKLYGIEGFCFYFYWFAGKRLLEAPILNYLADASLDLPFCLCWANENWSRRWDGLDSELLIAQEYSAEDDLAFIEYVSLYLRDPRYIRINGKPLLMVYRPNLLPDPVQTMERWRTWCRENGIGEIYLAYTQSFEAVNPLVYGMDAAIEFPPNNSSPPNITKDMTPISPDFEGSVYDWRVFIERSENYQAKDYTLFRSVCPSWDNTARRKNKSIAFANSSPLGFQRWLFNAIRDTCTRFQGRDERLIFVNAWNEWAEGAHLEPDQKYGYAWLEAVRMALVRSAITEGKYPADRKHPIAIVIHAFYEDVFCDIFHYLENIRSINIKIYVTCPVSMTQFVESKLEALKHEYYLMAVSNKGRDVLPFLKILKEVYRNNHDVIIKVHTKKSLHRTDGDIWRKDLYDKLLTESSIEQVLDLFEKQPEVGIWGPEGHIVPMSFYWGSNAQNVECLAARLGIDIETVNSLRFVAGTMFIARAKAIEPILHLAISEHDFEEEAGQVDGTLAHAIERVFSVAATSVGMAIGRDDSETQNGDYPFADRCMPSS